jgi:hypothetical protein
MAGNDFNDQDGLALRLRRRGIDLKEARSHRVAMPSCLGAEGRVFHAEASASKLRANIHIRPGEPPLSDREPLLGLMARPDDAPGRPRATFCATLINAGWRNVALIAARERSEAECQAADRDRRRRNLQRCALRQD